MECALVVLFLYPHSLLCLIVYLTGVESALIWQSAARLQVPPHLCGFWLQTTWVKS